MKDLLRLYSEENLGKITSRIINAYGRRDRETLDALARSAGLNPEDFPAKGGRLFKRLMVMFHPDRKSHFHNMIRHYTAEGNNRALMRMRQNIKIASEVPVQTIPTVHETYTTDGEMVHRGDGLWTDYLDGLSVREEISENWGFLEAVHAMMYGNLFSDFLPKDLYYLEGALDLSWSEIEDLKGIEYCRNITSLNLEGNRIARLWGIDEIPCLSALYLGRNEIEDISPLEFLKSLKTVDLSFNEVEDLSPLMNLPDLEYVNLLGNPVKDSPVLRSLRERCLVVYDEIHPAGRENNSGIRKNRTPHEFMRRDGKTD